MAPSSDAPGGMRILVAGDKSHAGKSTVSLGLLAALLETGFAPSDLAYIKPATQCVSSTLTARFCQANGIAYEHIGPVVFYRGFTREVLDTQTAEAEAAEAATAPVAPPADFPERCARAVDRISRGKRLTLIDGVGYPSVGSIIGCSSVDVAIACRAPVLIVGRPGVGDAIDSFNLCAAFFERQRVPVLGGVWNKMATKGFYARSNCDRYIRQYMAANRPRQRVYGALPAHDGLANLAGEEACGFAFKHPEHPPEAGALTADDEKAVAVVTELFREFVDTPQLVEDLAHATAEPAAYVVQLKCFPGCEEPHEGEAPRSKRAREASEA
jgi:Mrp family chromosome partitioning ATPase